MSQNTEDEIGQTFDQAIRTAIMTGSQSVQVAAQRQQTRTMNMHRDQQAAESAAREAQRRAESYRNEQISVIYSKVNNRNFWSQHDLGKVADYTAYVAQHQASSPRAQAALETLAQGFKTRHGVDLDKVLNPQFDPLKFRNDLMHALDDTLAVRRESQGPETGPRDRADQVAAADMERYVAAFNEHLGDRTARVLQEPAWPALFDQLHTAEQDGHDVNNLVKEITVDFGRDLDDAQDNAAVLQWRAERQLAQRTPERTTDANTAPASTAEAAKPSPRFTVYEFRNEADSSSEITRDRALGIVASTPADAEYDSRGDLGDIKGFKGKDSAIDWAIATKFPGLMTDEERTTVLDRVANETRPELEQRTAAAERLARSEAARRWWAGLSPAEREAQHEERDDGPFGKVLVRKQIEWDSQEWKERIEAEMKAYGLERSTGPTGSLASGAGTAAAQRPQPADLNQNQEGPASPPRAEPQALPAVAAQARHESGLGFPEQVPTVLSKLSEGQGKGRSQRPRARQHTAAAQRGQELER